MRESEEDEVGLGFSFCGPISMPHGKHGHPITYSSHEDQPLDVDIFCLGHRN